MNKKNDYLEVNVNELIVPLSILFAAVIISASVIYAVGTVDDFSSGTSTGSESGSAAGDNDSYY